MNEFISENEFLKKSKFYHEKENIGYPISSIESQRVSLKDILNREYKDKTLKEILYMEVKPTRIFELANKSISLLDKISQEIKDQEKAKPEEFEIERFPRLPSPKLEPKEPKIEPELKPELEKSDLKDVEDLKREIRALKNVLEQYQEIIEVDARYGYFEDKFKKDSWLERVKRLKGIEIDTLSSIELDELLKKMLELKTEFLKIYTFINTNEVRLYAGTRVAYIEPSGEYFITRLTTETKIVVTKQETISLAGLPAKVLTGIDPQGRELVVIQEKVEIEKQVTIPSKVPVFIRVKDEYEAYETTELLEGIVRVKTTIHITYEGKEYDTYRVELTRPTLIKSFYKEEYLEAGDIVYVPIRFIRFKTLSKLLIKSDRPPYAWRDHPETGDTVIERSPIGLEEPFFHQRQRGSVPYLSMPNVGDTLTDRTLTRGYSEYSEYYNKDYEKLKKEKIKQYYEDLLKEIEDPDFINYLKMKLKELQ